jgi:hypothetical protein
LLGIDKEISAIKSQAFASDYNSSVKNSSDPLRTPTKWMHQDLYSSRLPSSRRWSLLSLFISFQRWENMIRSLTAYVLTIDSLTDDHSNSILQPVHPNSIAPSSHRSNESFHIQMLLEIFDSIIRSHYLVTYSPSSIHNSSQLSRDSHIVTHHEAQRNHIYRCSVLSSAMSSDLHLSLPCHYHTNLFGFLAIRSSVSLHRIYFDRLLKLDSQTTTTNISTQSSGVSTSLAFSDSSTFQSGH